MRDKGRETQRQTDRETDGDREGGERDEEKYTSGMLRELINRDIYWYEFYDSIIKDFSPKIEVKEKVKLNT